MPVTRSPTRPVSGSPAYSPDNLPVYRGGAGGAAPAPSCTIALTDPTATVGGLPLTVDGQTVSYTNAAGINYYAAEDLAGYPIDWVGERLVEVRMDVYGSGLQKVAILDSALSLAAELYWNGTEWRSDVAGEAEQLHGGTISQRAAIGIDGATGDVSLYVDGAMVRSAVAFFTPGIDNILIFAAGTNLDAGTSGQWGVITDKDDFAATYVGDKLDWCGNVL